ncbi:hypothetical protein LWI28_019872 [Acer negundo]|uniref:EF-hand domain-containing protein n=1 Tax=Acer negundo TaxID=4023 RepID=A0AAD5IQS9_ACENE|nr:hypothetical protein LWI28_019872 [Acer negundo]
MEMHAQYQTTSSSSCSVGTVPLSSLKKQRTQDREHLFRHLRFTGFEWTDVEDRFDRLASTTRNGTEPVLKWSDFGFCIGMQKSQEFASEILRALRGRRQQKNYITKHQLYGFWHRMTDPCIRSRIQLFFDMCDSDMDGRISEMDIKQIVLLSASANKLTLSHEEAEEHAGLVMEVVDIDNRGYLEPYQLEILFKGSSPRIFKGQYQDDQEQISKAEIMFRSHWRRGWIIFLWLIVCIALFSWKFIQYRHRTAFEVMGYCLCTSKGAAETLKFNMALILLPVCRNSITWLRKNRRINSIVPFNDNINFHKLIAGGIVVGVILHGGTHLACDFPRISSSDHSIFRQTIASRFGYHQPSYIQILATTEAITGIAMVVLMSIAFSLATTWPRRQSPSLPRSVRRITGYNTFWYSHHLFVFVYTLLIVHSMFLFLTDNLTEKTTWMYIAIPVILYAGERIFRAIRSGFYDVKILKAILNGANEYPKIYIDGPYGAASQDYIKYDILVMIGLGIGVTPFISIIKDINQVVGKGSLKTYLYWVTREQSSFDWFREVIKEISKQSAAKEMHNFLTSVHEDGDARSALITAVQALYFARNGIDIVSRTPVSNHLPIGSTYSTYLM